MRRKARNLGRVALKTLKGLSLRQQLLFCEAYLPDAWEHLHDTSAQLPKFDDNDELMKEDGSDESIYQPGA